MYNNVIYMLECKCECDCGLVLDIFPIAMKVIALYPELWYFFYHHSPSLGVLHIKCVLYFNMV